MRKALLTLLTISISSHALLLCADSPQKQNAFFQAKKNEGTLIKHFNKMLKLQHHLQALKIGFESLKKLSDKHGPSSLSAKQQADLKIFESEITNLEEKIKLNLAEYWRFPSSELFALNDKIAADLNALKINPQYSTANAIGFTFPTINKETFTTNLSPSELDLALRSMNAAATNLGEAITTVNSTENLQRRIGILPDHAGAATFQATVTTPDEN